MATREPVDNREARPGAANALPVRYAPLNEVLLAPCAAIAATAPDPWSEAALAGVLQNPRARCVVQLQGQTPLAFASFLVVEQAADLQLVAVAPKHRRRQLAAALLTHCFAQLQAEGVRRVLLEMRCSNTAALALYQRLGFAVLAQRRGLYTNPAEDGLLMALALDGGKE